MRLSVDTVHPADVLFFKCPLDALRAHGEDFLILSRRKDVACELLDQFGFDHLPVSTARTGVADLAARLLRRDLGVFRAARQSCSVESTQYVEASLLPATRRLSRIAMQYNQTEVVCGNFFA